MTKAHVHIAQETVQQLDLDQIIFIPVGNHFNKILQGDPGGKIRMGMIQESIKDFPMMDVSDIQITQPKTSLLVDTVQEISYKYDEKVEIWVLLGADVASTFFQWENYKIILEYASLAVVNRGDEYNENLKTLFHVLPSHKIKQIETTFSSISSTQVRKNAFLHKPLSPLVLSPVADIIYGLQLYGAPLCPSRAGKNLSFLK